MVSNIDPFGSYEDRIAELEDDNHKLTMCCLLMSELLGAKADDETDEEFELNRASIGAEVVRSVVDLMRQKKLDRMRLEQKGGE